MTANQPATRRVADLFSLLRDSLRDVERDYTTGSTRRALVLLAVPMMLEMSMEAVFALVDMIYVARLGAAAVTVVGITEAMLTILYALAIGLSTATTALVARRIGEKRRAAAALAATQSLWLAALMAAAIGIPGALFAHELLGFMGADAEVIETGNRYTAVMLGGSASIFYIFLLNAVFRGAGDAAIAMRSLWLANGVNLVLDPCLIFGLGPFPELGVTGAAIATTIGRSTGIAYQLWHLTGARSRIRLRRRLIAPHAGGMLKLLRISAGGIGQYLVVTSSWLLVIRILATFGTNAVAGFTIAIRIMEFVYLPAWGLSNATATLVGQNLGARKPDRARYAAVVATRANVLLMLGVGIAFAFSPGLLLAPFTSDPSVLQIATESLRIIGAGLPLFAVGMILLQALNGAGDTITPTWLNLICYWLLQIPLAAWLARGTALEEGGVAWAITISSGLLSLLAWFVFRAGRWQQQAV